MYITTSICWYPVPLVHRLVTGLESGLLMVQLPGVAMALGAAASTVPAVVTAMVAQTTAVRLIRMGVLIPMIAESLRCAQIRLPAA
jgi:hypothetical protein